MKTKNIHKITKIIDTFSHIIVAIKAYDSHGQEVFCYEDIDGIGDSKDALHLNKLIYRKNTKFIEMRQYNNGKFNAVSFTR
jgi:hypothetical protein